MPVRLSKVLGVTREQLDVKGIFDSTIDLDSRLYIDPALFINTTIPEFQGAQQKITAYFDNILRLVKGSNNPGDALWRSALKKLTFGEGLRSGLGYSENGTGGRGIGPDKAAQILQTVKEIADAGINDPAIFELVPAIEEGIGSDSISDMVTIILKEEFLGYTRRIAAELGVHAPVDTKGKPLIFLPKRALSDLPTAEKWDDIEIVAAHNDGLRQKLNDLIGKSWKKAALEFKKQGLKNLLLDNPPLIKDLLANYRRRHVKSYDFQLDHLGLLLWDIVGEEAARRFPLDIPVTFPITAATLMTIAKHICDQYQQLIEYNGLVECLYDRNGDKRPERLPQLLFYAIADSYCKANNVDINREVNNGAGALDVKLSQGRVKVTIELKYSSNPKLIAGYNKQLVAYNNAEGVDPTYSIYLILRVNDNQEGKINNIRNIIKEKEQQGKKCPALYVINAIPKPSASKLS